MNSVNSVNIRPGVSILTVLKHLNYKPYFALAEFVDNAIDSFLKNQEVLKNIEGSNYKLDVRIEINQVDKKITIRDNAAGINTKDYQRAFRAAEMPPDSSGLSEFGMGMKSAACWFSGNWKVTSKAIGEEKQRVVNFDINQIVNDRIEELAVEEFDSEINHHFTVVELYDIHQRMPQKKTIGKIKEHLTSIYRGFIRNGVLNLYYNGELLNFDEPKILEAPFFKTPHNPVGENILWKLNIDFPVEEGLSVKGFVAIREKAAMEKAGLALFRRGRVILGSADEGFRPVEIFTQPNSFRYQRIFGELHLEGFEVSHTKDGFQGDENMQTFIQLLRDELDTLDFPLLKQADNYRVKPTVKEVKAAAENVLQTTIKDIKEQVPEVLTKIREQETHEDKFEDLQKVTESSYREIEIDFQDITWKICFELSYDNSLIDWVEVGDNFIRNIPHKTDIRTIGIRLSLAHPFMQRYAGNNKMVIEPLLRIAAAIGLAEITAKESGVKNAATIRRNVNNLLKNALSKHFINE